MLVYRSLDTYPGKDYVKRTAMQKRLRPASKQYWLSMPVFLLNGKNGFFLFCFRGEGAPARAVD